MYSNRTVNKTSVILYYFNRAVKYCYNCHFEILDHCNNNCENGFENEFHKLSNVEIKSTRKSEEWWKGVWV